MNYQMCTNLLTQLNVDIMDCMLINQFVSRLFSVLSLVTFYFHFANTVIGNGRMSVARYLP